MSQHHRDLSSNDENDESARLVRDAEGVRYRTALPSHRHRSKHTAVGAAHAYRSRPSRHRPSGTPAPGGWSRRSKAIAIGGVVVLASAGGAFASGVPHPAGASGAPVTVDLTPVADTYVSSGSPTAVRGTDGQVQASDLPGHHKTAYLRFQVPSWTGQHIVAAQLNLTRTNHHLSATVVANRVEDSSWSETAMTAQTAPEVGSALDRQQTTARTNTVSLDVRPAVKEGSAVTMALTSPSTDNFVAFQSREMGAAGPQLLVTLVPSGGGTSTPPSSSSAPSTSRSAPSTSQPAPTTSQPAPSTSRPAPATSQPAPSTSRPAPSTSQVPVPTSASNVPPPSTSPAPPPTGSSRTLFGAFPGFANQNDHSESWNSRLARVSAEFGGKLPVVRVFQEGNLTFPNLINPANGNASVGIISYTLDPSAVAAGRYDAQLVAIAQEAPANRPTVFCLDHEPEQTGRPYTAAQYVAGFRHFATVMRSVGNPFIKLAPIYENFTIKNDPNALLNAGYWPGDAYADYFGVDAYYNSGIPKFTTTEGLMANALSFSAAHSKPLIVGEHSIGSGGSSGGMGWTDQQWTNLVDGTIAALDGRAFAVTWFETWKFDGDWRMDSRNHYGYHSGAVAAWSAVADR